MNSGKEIAKVHYNGAHRILISAYHEFLVLQYVPWIMHVVFVVFWFGLVQVRDWAIIWLP